MTTANDRNTTLTCDAVQDWLWGTRLAAETPPDGVDDHLERCGACREEQAARAGLETDLRGLRAEMSAQPPRALDHRVLRAASTAVAARESGSHAPVAAAPTVGPVATPRWMTAAAALLAAAVGLGFVVGRFTATGADGFAFGTHSPAVHTTLATAVGGRQVDWRNMHRPHQVGISQDGLSRLQEGRTYLMTGPVGGPYQVVGGVQFDEVDLPSVFPRGTLKEIVVAVGPQEGWQTGRELALADLNEGGAEILGRRKVEDPPVRVGFTAP